MSHMVLCLCVCLCVRCVDLSSSAKSVTGEGGTNWHSEGAKQSGELLVSTLRAQLSMYVRLSNFLLTSVLSFFVCLSARLLFMFCADSPAMLL